MGKSTVVTMTDNKIIYWNQHRKQKCLEVWLCLKWVVHILSQSITRYIMIRI